MWDKIKNLFNFAIRKLWKIIKSVVSSALEMFMAQLISFAKVTVKNLMNSDLSNDEKRKEAFELIKERAICEDLGYKDSWINILIELALASVKKEF